MTKEEMMTAAQEALDSRRDGIFLVRVSLLMALNLVNESPEQIVRALRRFLAAPFGFG